MQPSISSRRNADGSRCPQRDACDLVPIRVVEKGGTSGHRYPSPGLGLLCDFCAGSWEVYCSVCCSTTRKLRSQTDVPFTAALRPPTPPASDSSATFVSAVPPAHRRSSGRCHSCRRRSWDRRYIRGYRSGPRRRAGARLHTSRTRSSFQAAWSRDPSLTIAGVGGGPARMPLRGPHRCARRSPCRFLRGVAASAPAALDIGTAPTCGRSQAASDP